MCSTLLWSFPPLGDVLIYKLPNVIIIHGKTKAVQGNTAVMGADQIGSAYEL